MKKKMSADEEQREQIRELKHDRAAVPLTTSCGPADSSKGQIRC